MGLAALPELPIANQVAPPFQPIAGCQSLDRLAAKLAAP